MEKELTDSRTAEWLEQMAADNATQAEYAKKQYRMAKIAAAACVGMLCVVALGVLILLPRALTVLNQMETVMENLETVSTDLAEADLPGMLDRVNGLVEASQEGMALAVERITALDIDGMNSAIADLQAIISPLAYLFGR